MNGFLPASRAPLAFDLVCVAMLAALPALGWSIRLARCGRHHLHQRVQLTLSASLGLVLALFELEVRINGWTHRAVVSPFFDNALFPVLYLHLSAAIPTLAIWVWLVASALVKSPISSGTRAATHRRTGRVVGVGTACTALSGWIFYWMAFVA